MKIISKGKILIHSNYYPNNIGGIQFVVKSILNCIDLGRYDLECFYGSNKTEVFSEKGITFHSRKIFFKFRGACFLSFGNIFFLISGIKSNLIIFQEPYPSLWPAILILRRLFNKKIIVLMHANPVSKYWVMFIYSKIRNFVFSGSICVSTSPNLLKHVDSNLFLESIVIPLFVPAIEPVYSSSLTLPNRYALYIGRLAHYKGLLYLLESVKKCPDINFVIAGDGSLANDIYKIINDNKLSNIYFINRFVTEFEKNELISKSDFLIFPSISENEAFGLVQLEAMRLKKPIVNTFLDSGVNYVAPDRVCAITVAKCNSFALTQAIRELWFNHEYIKILGINGYKRYLEFFSDEKFINSWVNLINKNFE
jgi:glycosyltransferase involved in cell wall biosynthesis